MGIGLNLMISYSQVARTGCMIIAKVLFSLVSDLYLDEPVDVTRGDSLTSSPDSEQGSYHLMFSGPILGRAHCLGLEHNSLRPWNIFNALLSSVMGFALALSLRSVWVAPTTAFGFVVARFIKQRFLPCLDAPISLRLIRHPDI
ncbi:hypothetical protein BU24DRAFT_27335 [Aaosphaeria arxii CBS 175.79]|uniref:Uncharacterized protein n=1 Tax=Aaosphaeria arxii CBS 175.79 TaxID=1450172 RepID=A0A6A5YAW6_9PLEO|nr:uncharacterized protein BU24DRAFT_27335 [Aaosphaeria arxii CBS 175.79]KAF2021734.1 hypothetical protein BU24DRAFT_27335 [Aaosphaeria arxii CBS 175.79]